MLINEEIIPIKRGTNQPLQLQLRTASEEDAKLLIDYLKRVCAESRYLLKEPEEVTMTLEQETAFIQNTNASGNKLLLLGFLDGNYVGNCSITGMDTVRHLHRASVGIALFQKYTGMGIGRAMLEKLIAVAKETGFEQVELEVVAENERAIRLYKNMGFEIYGTFPHSMKYKDGTYADAYWMMKKL